MFAKLRVEESFKDSGDGRKERSKATARMVRTVSCLMGGLNQGILPRSTDLRFDTETK